MSSHRTLWLVAVAGTVGTAVVGSLGAMAWGSALLLGVLLAVFGGVLGLALGPELTGRVGRPVLAGAALAVATALSLGLGHLIGGLPALGVVVALGALSPFVTSRAARWLRGRALPGRTLAAASAPPGEALRLQWKESGRQLAMATTPSELLLIVRVRQQILDDLLERSGGVLPDYVWSTSPGRGGGPDIASRGP
jgi:hypothetical protein